MSGKIRNKNRATTLDDVAALAGVSRITASRIVNGGMHVSKIKRDLVMRAVEELNYLPNLAARALAGAQESRIALVYANPSSTYLGELIMGALSGASKAGIQIILKPWRNISAVAERSAAATLAKNVEGVVLPSPLCDSKIIVTELVEAGVPIVAVGPGKIPEPLSCVRVDDFRASFEVTSYLIKLGHKRIGFITGNPAQSVSGRRVEGYKAAISQSGIHLDESLIKQGYFNYQSGLEATESLLGSKHPPTAIFASNDDMATAVINVAHRRGLDVPRDISVFGFDDLPMAVTVWPELSTVHQPVADMAEKAIEILLRKIRNRDEGINTAIDHVVSHRLVLRDSTTAPPKNTFSDDSHKSSR